ncbi:MAG: diaminopimelate epimerase [Candidatus Omnitrophota bacterium]|nr:diaminopimelate epimerase [Candidatus Omnitrophota bacterium]
MKKMNFTKMVASGNDFVVVSGGLKLGAQGLSNLAKNACDRKFGVGADGMLVLEKSRVADARMRIFNADGSEAEMCGNGARCAVLYISRSSSVFRCSSKHSIQTKAGIILYELKGDNIKIKLTDPKGIRMDIPVAINDRSLRINFINTGVPHAVVFVSGIDAIDVPGLGREIRYHQEFAPAGTNVDFVEIIGDNVLRVRTYERGVEDETLACGTGSVASAIIYALKADTSKMINVSTAGGEVLKVYFARSHERINNVWLEGRAKVVYTGVYNV